MSCGRALEPTRSHAQALTESERRYTLKFAICAGLAWVFLILFSYVLDLDVYLRLLLTLVCGTAAFVAIFGDIRDLMPGRLEKKMGLRKLKHHPVRIIGVIMAVAIVVLVFYELAASYIDVTGVVDHKVIAGIADNAQHTIVIMYAGDIEVYDHNLRQLFLGMDGNAVISASLEQELLNSGYTKILYLANIVVTSEDPVNNLDPGDALTYYVDKRSDFNALTFGASVVFEVRKGEPLHIVRVRD